MVTATKSNKFSKNPDYKKLFKHRPVLVSKDFSLWLGENQNLGIARFGVIVAKKNVRMAVIRNYLKRFSRELFKSYQHLFTNKDVVLVIKKAGIAYNLDLWKIKLAEVYRWLDHFGCRH